MSSRLSTGTKLKVIMNLIFASAFIIIGLNYLSIIINPPLLSFKTDWLVVASAIVFTLGGIVFIIQAIWFIRKEGRSTIPTKG
ncbi:MAG: hypothetical protein ACETWM_16625 [Candidatus Lokiarchaeia archaeon]